MAAASWAGIVNRNIITSNAPRFEMNTEKSFPGSSLNGHVVIDTFCPTLFFASAFFSLERVLAP